MAPNMLSEMSRLPKTTFPKQAAITGNIQGYAAAMRLINASMMQLGWRLVMSPNS